MRRHLPSLALLLLLAPGLRAQDGEPASPAAGDAPAAGAQDDAGNDDDAHADDHAAHPLDDDHPSRITDEYIPLATLPVRPQPIVELGNPFLQPGLIDPGTRTATGATVQPSFMLFGNLRSGVSYVHEGGEDTVSDQANRLDLFGNLQLTGTERILVGVRPLDDYDEYYGRSFRPEDEGNHATDWDLESLFFEGELGEVFPGLDPDDSDALDYGVSIGLQPVTLQGGLLMEDNLTLVSVTRNSIRPAGSSNLRLTGLFGWRDVNRGDNRRDGSAKTVGFLAERDTRARTLEVDVLGVTGDARYGDSYHVGVGSTQRIGHLNTTFRVASSLAQHDDSPQAADGTVLFSEVSWTPHGTDDNHYVNTFLAIDEFTSASRREDAGGPLGRAGILFAAPGLGAVGAPLSNAAEDVVGGAWGYQRFLDGGRKQVITELGVRKDTDGADDGAVGVGARYQQAVGQRSIFQVDLFGGYRERAHGFAGARCEWQVKF